MKTTISVSEIFGPTIQGEGALVGRPTVFVRTGGCDFRCSWCDTLYAVLPEFRSTWADMTASEILDKVKELSGGRPLLVTLSGGNPALQPFGELIRLGNEQGYTFALETQGSVARPWFGGLAQLVLSPKPPSSGMPFESGDLVKCLEAAGAANMVFKVVVFDEDDFGFALRLKAEFSKYPWYLQPGNATAEQSFGLGEPLQVDVALLAKKTEWLLRRALEAGWTDVTILPQLHTLLWGNKRAV